MTPAGSTIAVSSPLSAIARGALPRVLYPITLDPSKKFGSMEAQIVLLAEQFQAEGSVFLPLFISHAADVGQFHRRGVYARCLELRRFSWQTLTVLNRLVHEQKIDLVHWNFTSPLTNPYLWGLSLGAPRVRHWFTDHNSRIPPLPSPPRGLARLAKRFLLGRYARVLCVSGFVRDCLVQQGVWSNLVVTPHFIDTERLRPDGAVRSHLRISLRADDRFVLVAVGHLIKEKGIDVAVRAMADLPAGVVLWVVGGGPEEEALRRLIAELRLDNRVQLLGLQRDVRPYLQAADCFVCPSLWEEAAGLVNLEAQACGTPVVASRIGGIPEYVADGQTGFLFPPGDHRALARCVHRFVDDDALRLQFAQDARTRAQDHFSPAVRMTEWLDLYRTWRESQ